MRFLFTSLGRKDTHAPTPSAQHHPPIMEPLEGRQLCSASHLHVASAPFTNFSTGRPHHHHHAVTFSAATHPRRHVIFVNPDFGGFFGINTGEILATQAFAPPSPGLSFGSFTNPVSFGFSSSPVTFSPFGLSPFGF